MNLKEIVYATPAKTNLQYHDFVPNHNGSADHIKIIDMLPAFICGSNKYFKNADITFDKYHLIKQLNEAIDTIRRNEA